MYFLVDFENAKNLGLRGTDALEPEDGLVIFFSETSSRVERRYLEEIEKSGCTFEVCKLVKSYKNALDFYIASKSGEIFGGGYKGTIAIISKDEGFKAVRDYWTHRAKPSHHMVVCESVERAILAAGGPYPRVRMLSARITTLGLEDFYNKLDDRRQRKLMLDELFEGTPLAEKMDMLDTLVQKSQTPKELYLNALHDLGREDGLIVYRKLKERVVFNATEQKSAQDDNALVHLVEQRTVQKLGQNK